MKKVTKDDVKKFWSEHKLEIIRGTICSVGVAMIGYSLIGVGYNIRCKELKDRLILLPGPMKDLLKDAANKYDKGNNGITYTVIEPGFTAAELGKLGDKMLKNKCGDDKFTHFVLLGPNPER